MNTRLSIRPQAVRAASAIPQPLEQALAAARAHIVAELFAPHRVLPQPAAVFEPGRPIVNVSAYGPNGRPRRGH